MSGPERRIIVIRRPVQGKGHHGGGWKIAYADFMTAMMAFFLVMWLLSSSSKHQLQGIAEHFKTPLKVALAGGPASSMSTSVIPGGGPDPTNKEMAEIRQGESDADDSQRLEELKQQLDNMIESSPVLKQFRPQLLIDITPEGLRIQIVDSSNRPMFDRSSAIVVSYMRAILREIGPVLNAQPNKITLSGHTDATQYSRGDSAYSNWELSADRANASRRELIAGGMQETKVLRVMGVASSMHLNPDDPYAPVNRRISLVVLNHRAQADIEKANAAVPAKLSGTAGAGGRPAGTRQGESAPAAGQPSPDPSREKT
jgi:chemotaxis protein MotB